MEPSLRRRLALCGAAVRHVAQCDDFRAQLLKELRLVHVPKVLLQSASMSSMLLYIIINAVLFSFLMTHEQIPQAMAAWIIHKNLSVWVFLLVANLILLPPAMLWIRRRSS